MEENPEQVTKAFHLLVESLCHLTSQYYEPSHPMFKTYAKMFQASKEMEVYLKAHYPTEFTESFKDEE